MRTRLEQRLFLVNFITFPVRSSSPLATVPLIRNWLASIFKKAKNQSCKSLPKAEVSSILGSSTANVVGQWGDASPCTDCSIQGLETYKWKKVLLGTRSVVKTFFDGSSTVISYNTIVFSSKNMAGFTSSNSDVTVFNHWSDACTDNPFKLVTGKQITILYEKTGSVLDPQRKVNFRMFWTFLFIEGSLKFA